MNAIPTATPRRTPTHSPAGWVRWRFRLSCPQADRVYLVVDPMDAPSTWLPMRRDADSGSWCVEASVARGSNCRFRYYLAQGSAILNGGDHGLMGQPVEVDRIDHADSELALSA